MIFSQERYCAHSSGRIGLFVCLGFTAHDVYYASAPLFNSRPVPDGLANHEVLATVLTLLYSCK